MGPAPAALRASGPPRGTGRHGAALRASAASPLVATARGVMHRRRHAPAWHACLGRLRAAGLWTMDKPDETPASTLRALWLAAAGRPCSVAATAGVTLPPLDAAGIARLRALVEQRLAGRPLAHLTGRQRFMGLEMLAGPDALIPRPETELLAAAAVARLQLLAAQTGSAAGPGPLVIDTCTGSGNVAAALAAAVPSARVHAADLSPEAVQLARRNLDQLGLGRVHTAVGDLLGPFDQPELLGRVDLITCNPPYISSGRLATMPGAVVGHEPTLAFDGGPLGVRVVQRLVREAPRWLRPGGWLVFEVGLGQGPAVAQRLRASGDYGVVDELVDEAGEVRVLAACRPS